MKRDFHSYRTIAVINGYFVTPAPTAKKHDRNLLQRIFASSSKALDLLHLRIISVQDEETIALYGRQELVAET